MGLLCLLRNKDSGAPVVDPVQAIDHDQLLLRDSYAAHYTTAEWPGFEHLLADRKYTVGTLRTPRAGRCWLFDGTDDIATASTALLTGTGDFTICAWLKASSVSTGHIAGNYATGNSGGVQFALNTGKLQLYLGSALAGSTTLSTNTWYHVAVVRQSGVVTIYLDAIADGSGTRSSSITGSTNFSFGALTAGGERLSGKLRDLRVYNSAKTAAEILAIKNQADSTYDTTGLLAGYWCEEESGTTGYDWSGNGRNPTLTSITQATFHAADTGVTYSDANVRGYRLSGSVYIPATSSTLAADGNALTVTGKCPQPGYAPQKCVTGDGSSVHVDTQSFAIGTSDFTFTFWAKGTGASPKVAVYMPSLSIQFVSSTTISPYDYTGPGHVFGASALNNWNATSWHKVVVSRSSGQISIAVDGIVNATAANTSNFGTGTIQIFGFSGQYWDGQVSNASLLLGGVTYYWPLCEGPGSGSTNRGIYYLKSDNTSGVLASAIVNGTVSTIWANATDYTSGVFNWPLRYGYTVNGSGVIVPAKLDGLLDAAGNAIGTAAGGWASGLQNLNCLPYTNPLGVSVGLETSLDPTADRKTTSSSKRRRRNTSGRYDRFGARSTAMSDASSNAYFGD